MRDLLKEAIADAKAVRETALANAKIALEEAFTPRLQSMISARLREEEEMEDPVSEEEDMDMEAPVEEGDEMDKEAPVEEGDEEDYMAEEEDMEEPVSEEEDMEEPVSEEEEMDAELEEILRELEGDDHEEMTEEEMEDEPVAEGEEEEEVSIEEVIRALREEEEMEEGEEEEPVAEEESAETEKELAEAIRVIKFLKAKINEVNLLNAKLLFSNKLFRNYPLSESQKVKVIENFDRARTVREVKLVYGTISESLKTAKTKRPIVKESYASRPSKSTAPKKAILSEGNDLAARWKKLANLK